MRLESRWSQLRDQIDLVGRKFEENPELHPTDMMCALLIAGEDHRFKYHMGFDPIALCRATWKTYMLGSCEGGSTIAMQLVRTVTGKYEKKVGRKITEIQLAYKLTRYLSKERMPAIYLWVAYYGWRMNNFAQACNRLRIDPRSSTLLEAAELVARLKYPQPRNLRNHRAWQIENRSRYLIRRYRRQTLDKYPEEPLKDGAVQSFNRISQDR